MRLLLAVTGTEACVTKGGGVAPDEEGGADGEANRDTHKMESPRQSDNAARFGDAEVRFVENDSGIGAQSRSHLLQTDLSNSGLVREIAARGEQRYCTFPEWALDG